MKAKGTIEAGSLLSATTPDLFIGIGTVLMSLGLLAEAIKNFTSAIEQVKDNDKLKVAWNNEGVCFMRLNQEEDALPCFDKALKIDPNLEEAKRNKQKCLDSMKRKTSII